MLIAAELPAELMRVIDLHLANHRLTLAANEESFKNNGAAISKATRSQLVRVAILHYLECVLKLDVKNLGEGQPGFRPADARSANSKRPSTKSQ